MDQACILMFKEADERARLLLATFGAVMEGGPCKWTISIERLEEAVDGLAALNYAFRVEYDSPPTGEEGADGRAAYLPLIENEEERVEPGPRLVYLTSDPSPNANREFVELLASLAPELEWEAGVRPEWFRVCGALALPDPIQVRTLFNKWQGVTGLWSIAHDGRQFFTKRNLASLLNCGVAMANKCQYRMEVFPVLPILVYSGRAINLLLENGVRLDGVPQYFLLED